MKDLAGLMQQAKEMQERLEAAQAEVAAIEVEGVSGAGLVRVTLNGQGHFKRVKIDPALMKPDETEVLEDLLAAAFNDARRKAEEAAQEKMKTVAGGLAGLLPPGFKPPF